MSKRLTFETELGTSIEREDEELCPTCSICWACEMQVKECQYFNDAIEKLKHYEDLQEQGKLIILE